MSSTTRPVLGIVPASHQLEGAGFGVFRPFPTAEFDLLDPFLLLDEMEPVDHKPGEAQGAPDHPHRGFETVTYMLEGEFEHRDSLGNEGVIGPGGIQWMTAGDGIVHSEMPSRRIQAEGGRVHGFQLWVNLPADQKRAAPRYQGLDASELTTVNGDGWTARIVAGSMLGADGPAITYTPIAYAHITVEPGAEIRIETPDHHQAGVYAFKGSATVGPDGHELMMRTMAIFDRVPGDLVVNVPADAATPVEALVLSGQPIDEPVARYGPFVMNTRDQLIEAVDDFQAGRMGKIAATGTL